MQIDPEVRERLTELYPSFTISEVIRLALDYVLETRPVVVRSHTKLQSLEGSK